MSTWVEVFGWYGAVAILLAYALLAFRVVEPGRLYHLLNLTGAAGIVAASWVKDAYQPAALNLVWMLLAATALLRPGRPPADEATAAGAG